MSPDIQTHRRADESAVPPEDVPAPRSASSGLPALSPGWVAGAWLLVALAMALAAGSFLNSFSAVRDAVEQSIGDLAWTIPVLIDVGVGVFSGIDLLFTRLGMRLWWLRLVPWSLTLATVWLNVADETDAVGIVAHAAPPLLWVVTVELAAHVVRAGAGLEAEQATRRARGRMDRVRLSRWLLAPWSTLLIRRWMILQEERSYERVLARWWARKEAKWELQDTYGVVMWRVRAPRRARGLYRSGHLALSATADQTPPAAASPAGCPSASETDDQRPAVRAAGNTARRRSRRSPAGGRQRASFADFSAAAAELESEDRPVNRTLVGQRLRTRGLSVANDRADEYLARYLADRNSRNDGQAA